MARRAPLDEKPFRPLDPSVLNSVMQHTPEAMEAVAGARPEAPTNIIDLRATAINVPQRSDIPSPKPSLMGPAVQRFDQEKRILFTREETQALDRLVSHLAVRLSAQVKLSHVMRALTMLLLHAENQIHQRAGDLGPLIRPSNGDFGALQRFERVIASVLAHAMRDAGVPR